MSELVLVVEELIDINLYSFCLRSSSELEYLIHSNYFVLISGHLIDFKIGKQKTQIQQRDQLAEQLVELEQQR